MQTSDVFALGWRCTACYRGVADFSGRSCLLLLGQRGGTCMVLLWPLARLVWELAIRFFVYRGLREGRHDVFSSSASTQELLGHDIGLCRG